MADPVPLVLERVDMATGKVVGCYPSYKKAAEALACSRKKIADIVNGGKATMKKGDHDHLEGYSFSFRSATVEQIEVATSDVVASYATFAAAGQALDCPFSTISGIAKGRKNYKNKEINGCTFRFCPAVVEKTDITTGEVKKYASLTDAGKALKCDPALLSRLCKGETNPHDKQWKGTTFRVRAAIDSARQPNWFDGEQRQHVGSLIPLVSVTTVAKLQHAAAGKYQEAVARAAAKHRGVTRRRGKWTVNVPVGKKKYLYIGDFRTKLKAALAHEIAWGIVQDESSTVPEEVLFEKARAEARAGVEELMPSP
jgi:hypothetical protein